MQDAQIWVLLVFTSAIFALVFTKTRPAIVFSSATLALLITNQLSLQNVFHNLANPGLVTLVILLIVSTAVDKSGFIKTLGRKLIVKDFKSTLMRILGLSFFSSAILNNTAIVASLIGPIKQSQLHPPSKLLLPLSYSAILGGTVTLIGTSTNLIVDSFLVEQGHPGFAFWDFTLYGMTAGMTCCILLLLFSKYIPDIETSKTDYKQYFIEAKVEASSSLVGKSVEANHLRNLPELFLVEIVRNDQLISPVTPDMIIEAKDKLIFSGNIHRVDTLSHIDGLSFFAENNGLLKENLTEVIISNRAPIINKTLKTIGFRALFDAAVVAIRRDGEELHGKLGEIELRAGDFLLLATGPDFDTRQNIKNNFFVVSEVNLVKKFSPLQEWVTLGGFLTAITLAAGQWFTLPISLLCLLALLVFTGALSGAEIKRSLPLNLIAIIVGALSLSLALEKVGLIQMFSEWLEPLLMNSSPFIALVIVYLTTLVLTELVTNNAAAALMFPFAFGISQALNMPIMPFALTVAFAASASFISPYGYQTNLLVFSAGNYRFKHFIKMGFPISATYSIIVLSLLKYNYGL